MCQWRSETLDKESIWDEATSASLSRCPAPDQSRTDVRTTMDDSYTGDGSAP